jgi:uncharacterized protein YbaR (Trm112 family)
MPVVSCPNCRGELDLDAADLGHRVECPLCRGTFTATAEQPPPAASRAPDSPADGEQVVRCRRCDGQVTVSTADLGQEVTCPLCNRWFVAREEGEGRWLPRYDGGGRDRDDRPRRRSRYADEWDDDRDLVEFAKRECNAAGIGLMVTGWIGLALSPLLILVVVLDAGGGKDEAVLIAVFGGFFLFQVVVSILQIVGGRQMRHAKSWGLGMTACISGLGSFLLCGVLGVLGLVFGIIGIVKLNNQRVKRGFQLNNPHYDPDS